VQNEPSGGAGQAGRDEDELGPQRARRRAGVQRPDERAGGAVEVERDVASTSQALLAAKCPGKRQRAVLQVDDDLLDDGVPAVNALGPQRRQCAVDEDGVIPRRPANSSSSSAPARGCAARSTER
jgi:hypothetical protein